MNATHSPLPFARLAGGFVEDANGQLVARGLANGPTFAEYEANADLFVRGANCHAELVAALEGFVALRGALNRAALEGAFDVAAAALAKAKAS